MELGYIMLSHVTGEPCFFPSDVPQEYVSEALGQLKNSGHRNRKSSKSDR